MKHLLLILLFITPSLALSDVNWPKTKFDVGDCITPTNTTWTWYGKTAVIDDLVFSKFLDGFAYQIHIFGLNRYEFFDKFDIPSIEDNTAKVTPCPN